MKLPRQTAPLAIATLASATLAATVASANEQRLKSEPQLRTHTNNNPGLQCLVTSDRQTVRDATNYPGAYEAGYQHGSNDRLKNFGFHTPTKTGELARGYNDGYYFKTYVPQTFTVPTEHQVSCGCRTKILKNVVFREEIEAACQPERIEIVPSIGDAYRPNAYADGYREGVVSKSKRENYLPRTAGGEFARGFEDGYFGRTPTGQRYTEVPAKDYRCRCRLTIDRSYFDRGF